MRAADTMVAQDAVRGSRQYMPAVSRPMALVPAEASLARRESGAIAARRAVDIQICFSTKNSLFSRVLRWILRSRISHVCLTYHNETFDRVMVLELQGRGFVSLTWTQWRARNRVISRYRLQIADDEREGLTDPQVRRALAHLAEWLGTEFDYPSLLGFWLRPLVKGRRVLFNSPRKLVCSGAVATFLKHAGFSAIEDPDAIDPVELHALVEGHPHLFAPEHADH